MPVSFFAKENFKQILNFANGTHADRKHCGFTHWLIGWLMTDKNRKSCSIHCNNFEMVAEDLLTWFQWGFVTDKLSSLLLLRQQYSRLVFSHHYNNILDHMLSWFRAINFLEIECPLDLEQDLIKLLGLSLALLNFFTSESKGSSSGVLDESEDDSDLTEEDKIRILQGYYYWLVLKYSCSPQALAILQNRAATLKPVEKTGRKRQQTFQYVVDSQSLHDRLDCTLQSKSAVCSVFLEYWLAYYDPDQGLRASRRAELQEGTDFLIPAVDFMRKYRDELAELDEHYTYAADVIPAYRTKPCRH